MKRGLVIGMALAAGWVTAAQAPAAIMVFSNLHNEGTTSTLDLAVDKDNVAGVPLITQFGGSIDEDGAAGTAFVDADSTAHPAGQALGFDSGINDSAPNGFVLSLDTSGWQDMTLRFDYRATATGSASLNLEYRVGGAGPFTLVSTESLTNDAAYHALSKDLSAIGAIENTAGVELRVIYAAGSGSGTAQADNLQLTGSLIPEPAAGSLALGGAMLLLGRRRK